MVPLRICTVTVPVSASGKLLLGRRKKPGFGCGFQSGFGGKVEEGETIDEAAFRELHEETELEPGHHRMSKCGVVNFHFVCDPSLDLELHVYRSDLILEIDSPISIGAKGEEHETRCAGTILHHMLRCGRMLQFGCLLCCRRRRMTSVLQYSTQTLQETGCLSASSEPEPQISNSTQHIRSM